MSISHSQGWPNPSENRSENRAIREFRARIKKLLKQGRKMLNPIFLKKNKAFGSLFDDIDIQKIKEFIENPSIGFITKNLGLINSFIAMLFQANAENKLFDYKSLTFYSYYKNYNIMNRISINIPYFAFSKLQKALDLLSLKPPVNKKQIKIKYFQLAKMHHPDLNPSKNRNQTSKDLQHSIFVEITQAYKYLGQLSQQQINNPQSEHVEEESSRQSYNREETEERGPPLSEQEKKRQATYSYFNKKYKKQHQEQLSKQKEPLYKQVPELFAGCIFVMLFLCEWAYAAYKRSQNIMKHTSQEQDLQQAFQNLNFKRMYGNKNLPQRN